MKHTKVSSTNKDLASASSNTFQPRAQCRNFKENQLRYFESEASIFYGNDQQKIELEAMFPEIVLQVLKLCRVLRGEISLLRQHDVLRGHLTLFGTMIRYHP